MKVISTLPRIFLLVILSFFTFQTYADEVEVNSDSPIVHVNSDSAEKMAQGLKGVGLKKAQAIVSYRENYGNFHHIDELTAVKGIGKNTVAKNKELISLE